jgi:hypothetical protein
MDSIAVLETQNEEVVVWSVFVGSRQANPFSRLTGAWVMPKIDLGQLHIWSSVSAAIFLDDISQSLFLQIPEHIERTNVEQLHTALTIEVTRLDKVYEAQEALRSKKSKLVAPRWPVIFKSTVEQSRAEHVESNAHRVLEVARWISYAADCWDQIEEIRLARPYMRLESGDDARAIPWLSRRLTSDRASPSS